MPIKQQINHHGRPVSQEVSEREIWYKLVVKILRWKDGFSEGRIVNQSKINTKEWNTYRRHIAKTNVVYGRQKVLQDLNKTKKLIESNNGFE